MDTTLLNTLIRPQHQQIWKEVTETAMKDGVEQEMIKKITPYVYAAMEQLRKKFGRPPSGAGSKRKQGGETSKSEPQPKKKPGTSTADPPKPPKEDKPKQAGKEDKKGKGDEERKKEEGRKKNFAKEFDSLKDYNLIITGIPTIHVEESPKLKVIKLPYMAPEKLTAVLKETKGWDKTNHAVVVVPRAWSGIDGAEDKIYNLMDMLEGLSATLELSFLAPPVDDKTPELVHQFIDRVKTKMILHDLPPAKFQSRGKLCQVWYSNAIKDFLELVMDKEDAVMKSVSDISLSA